MSDKTGKTASPCDHSQRRQMPEPPLDLYHHLPFQIGRLTNLIRQVTSDVYVRHSGLSAREWRVLAMLGCGGEMRPAQLATECGMDRATVTRALGKLEQLDFIIIGADENDKRRKLLYLTAKGVEICERIRPLMDAGGQELEQVLSKTELKYYYQIMTKLQKKAQQMMMES